MASVIKRTDSCKWFAQWYVNGKVYRRSTRVDIIPKDGTSTPAKNKRIAKDIADAFERSSTGNSSVEAIAKALRAAADALSEEKRVTAREYLENYRAGGQFKNQQSSRRVVLHFLRFLESKRMADEALTNIKTKTCEEFLGGMLQEVTEGSVGVMRSYLSACFNRAVHDEVIQRNPFSNIKLQELVNQYSPETKGIDKTEREAFTLEELQTILFEFPAPYADLACLSVFCGGLRLMDAVNIAWSSIDFEKNELSIITQKTKARHRVPLVPELRRRLELLRETAAEGAEFVFPDLVAISRRAPSTVSSTFTNLLLAHGILKNEPRTQLKGRRRKVNKKSFHALRHSTPFLMQSLQVPASVTQALSTHQSAVVHARYTHATQAAKADALNKLEQLIMPHPRHQKTSA